VWIEKHGPTWRIRDQRGARKLTVASGFPNKTSAKNAMKIHSADQLRGELVMPSAGVRTVGEWSVTWWEARRANLAPNTQRSEWSRIRANIIAQLGDLQLNEVTQLVVQTWVTRLSALPRKPKTVHNAHGALHSIMAAAVTEKLIRVNPCVGTVLPRAEVDEMLFLTEPEARRLLVALPEHYRPLVETALGTAMRWGELAGLRVRRADVLAGKIRVEETLSELAGSAEIVFGPPKSRRSRRTITLAGPTRETLIPLVSGRDGEALVFTAPRGGPLRVRNFRRVWKNAVKRAGLNPGLRFHDLRHTSIAWLLSAGVPILAVSRRAGHASISITADRYGHLLPEADEGVLKVLNAAMGGTVGGTESVGQRLTTLESVA
jgi:integrase